MEMWALSMFSNFMIPLQKNYGKTTIVDVISRAFRPNKQLGPRLLKWFSMDK